MKTYKKDHFVLNRWILRGAGLWAPLTKSKFKTYSFRCYAVTVLLFVNFYFTLTEFMSIKDTYKNLNTLIKNLSFALTHLLGAIKVFFWYYHREELMRIINVLQGEDYCYKNGDEVRLEELFGLAQRTGLKYTFAFFAMALVTVSSAYIPPIITTLINPKFTVNPEGDLVFSQPLPYYSWMPFNYDTPKSYFLALVYQMGPMYSYAFSIVGMDTLFMNILNLIGAHLSAIKDAFRTIRARCLNKLKMVKNNSVGKENLNEAMKKEFERCVQHTQTMFGVCKDLEKIYRFLTLVQVLFTLFIFCTCLFLVSTTPITSKRFASEMVYLIAIGFQLMLYCWFGNEVTFKASEIPDALWESDWLETDCSYKQNMLITMIRMRRPLHVTVGKFAPLTLNTFVSILRSSYSLFAVLKSVND